ncbi:hypothetical protein C0J52_10196, partial [Blattella germanica]
NGIEGRARREDKELAFENKDTNEIIDRICGKRNRLTNTGTNRAIYDLMHGILKDLQQSAQRNLKRAREKAAKQTTMVNKEEKSTSSGPDQNKQFTDNITIHQPYSPRVRASVR